MNGEYNDYVDETLCCCNTVHQNVVESVHTQLFDDGLLKNAAEMFKALGDPTRLKIINALILAEMCVCDMVALTKTTQPAVSHHLKVLRQLRLVKYRRDGKIVYYSLEDGHVRKVFEQGLLHAGEAR
jgi:ArsR family transcriptional regulator